MEFTSSCLEKATVLAKHLTSAVSHELAAQPRQQNTCFVQRSEYQRRIVYQEDDYIKRNKLLVRQKVLVQIVRQQIEDNDARFPGPAWKKGD
ncbi:hypothetical protein N7481_011129 [Penicillium waksmanii]|uniref:uncharacterized protein n=1 Tax=Penicillium waksmanii TaxID=69791 RepID=UPI002548431A|nr:uncharacterized protein N7481_011129 [Penicillium waksmanii]KAJ5973919.1 hypothetical protein N7481_011129 [Penicillium waksmanii]